MKRLDLDLTPILNFGEFLFRQKIAIKVIAASNRERAAREDAPGGNCVTFEFRGWVQSTLDSRRVPSNSASPLFLNHIKEL
jgi:hypothetical protein